jgi:hypothetical protein
MHLSARKGRYTRPEVRAGKHKYSGRNVAVAMLSASLVVAAPALAEVGAIATKERAQEKRGEVDAELAKRPRIPSLISRACRFNTIIRKIGATKTAKVGPQHSTGDSVFAESGLDHYFALSPLIDQKDAAQRAADDPVSAT